MAKVKNTTKSTITVDVEGTRHRIGPGKTADVTAREALILGEHPGLEVGNRRQAIEAQDIPETDGETRHTGGRQHVIDEPRANKPGTPVTETGDTGSTTGTGIQGVSAAEHAKGEPNEVRGAEENAAGWVDELKGADLDAALKAAGLSTDGKVEDKRARLREHHTPTA